MCYSTIKKSKINFVDLNEKMRKREKGRNYINKQRHANLFLNRRNRLHTIISKIKLLDLGYGSEENHDK